LGVWYSDRAADNALWAPFLEKAWAKVNGNYEKIISGSEQEAFMFLTGVSSTSYNIVANFASNPETVWSTIRDADLKAYVMTISTGGGVNVCNLVIGHAYSLIGTVILYNADGTVAY
jgi:hypothetical protein